jgi:hypothetical protein
LTWVPYLPYYVLDAFQDKLWRLTRWGWRMLVKAMRGKNNIRTILDIIWHQCSEGNITLQVF